MSRTCFISRLGRKICIMFGVNMPFSQRSRKKIAAAFPTVGAVQLKMFQVFNFLKILLTFDNLIYLYLLTTETFCLLLVVFSFCCRGFQEQQHKEIAFPTNETKCQAGHNWMGKGFIEPGVGYIAFQVQTLIDSLYKIQWTNGLWVLFSLNWRL